MAQYGCEPVPRYPNNPLGIPFLLESAKALKEHRFLQLRAAQLETYGRTFQHQQFPETSMAILTVEPENIKAILSTKFEDWIIPKQRSRVFKIMLGSHSIFTINGPEWQHSRAMLRPAFVRNQISDLQCFDRHITKLIKRMPKDGSRFDLQSLFAMLTIDTISDFMFGQPTDVLGEAPASDVRLGASFDTGMLKVAMRRRLGWVTEIFPDPELGDLARFVSGYVDDFVAKRRRTGTMTSKEQYREYVFLDELLKSGEPDDVVRDHLISIFFAGRDTTTSVLTYLFYELSRRPDVVSKIREEISELEDDNPAWEQLKHLKYLNWAVKEALRLHPPVPSNSRAAVRDTVLPIGGGRDGKSPVFVPKDTLVYYQIWTVHRRKDIYGEDAEEFRPERWETLKPGHEYLPFNGGPRICIGQNFALTQMAMATFRLLQYFKTIERQDDRPAVLKVGINVSLLHGCWVSMTPA
ncbi:cytochrome P450 [Truncatella angustata]|uniref:Cytochrome P450 n=1 Tax=Truncatella angustata TaxID=152316 RepID=A0A9P8UMB4_9PEZI|nr:cytochrome P450 [Truncatella angustata]KAH6654776.1 cytochrome P450 [Truncatella angustata]